MAEFEATAPEQSEADSPQAEPTAEPREVSAPEPSEAEVPAAEGEEDPASVVRDVCSSFSFDLRGMPHTGPYEVSESLIQIRTQGLMQTVRDSAGEPAVGITYHGGSSFQAHFSDLAQCERVRGEVAPPPPANASRRQQMSGEQASPCGPCE